MYGEVTRGVAAVDVYRELQQTCARGAEGRRVGLPSMLARSDLAAYYCCGFTSRAPSGGGEGGFGSYRGVVNGLTQSLGIVTRNILILGSGAWFIQCLVPQHLVLSISRSLARSRETR